MGILGANGSGKSTLIRMLSTLLIPDTGHVSIFGYDVEKDEQMVQRLINRVSVEASFFKKLSPMENLIYAARLYNMPGAEARETESPAPEAPAIEERDVESLRNEARNVRARWMEAHGIDSPLAETRETEPAAATRCSTRPVALPCPRAADNVDSGTTQPRTGRTRSTASSAPPTNSVSRPAAASWGPPLTAVGLV